MGIMAKFNQHNLVVSQSPPAPLAPVTLAPTAEPLVQSPPAHKPTEQALIQSGLLFKGTITGTGALFIDCEILGNIDLPDSRVTVGPHGKVSDGMSVCIRARDIVVMGKIRGNISAVDLVEIRASGSLTGNISAARISIADGAFFKGDIVLHTPQSNPAAPVVRETDEAKSYA